MSLLGSAIINSIQRMVGQSEIVRPLIMSSTRSRVSSHWTTDSTRRKVACGYVEYDHSKLFHQQMVTLYISSVRSNLIPKFMQWFWSQEYILEMFDIALSADPFPWVCDV